MRRTWTMAGVVGAAVAIGALLGATIGAPVLSGAASNTTTSAVPPKPAPHIGAPVGDKAVFDAAAKALGLSTQQLLQKLSDGTTTIADVAREQHVTIQKVIDAMTAAARTSISGLVNRPLPQLRKGAGAGRPGPGGIGFGRGIGTSLGATAKALGITQQALTNDLRNGQSIADVAKAQHVDVNKLVATLVNDAKAKIDAAVKAGRIKQAQANDLEQNLTSRITKLVNAKRPAAGGGPGYFGGHGPRFGFGAGPGKRGNGSGPAPQPSIGA